MRELYWIKEQPFYSFIGETAANLFPKGFFVLVLQFSSILIFLIRETGVQGAASPVEIDFGVNTFVCLSPASHENTASIISLSDNCKDSIVHNTYNI